MGINGIGGPQQPVQPAAETTTTRVQRTRPGQEEIPDPSLPDSPPEGSRILSSTPVAPAAGPAGDEDTLPSHQDIYEGALVQMAQAGQRLNAAEMLVLRGKAPDLYELACRADGMRGALLSKM